MWQKIKRIYKNYRKARNKKKLLAKLKKRDPFIYE